MPFSSKFYLYKRSNMYYYIGYSDKGHLRWKSTKATLKSDALKALGSFPELLRTKPRSLNLSLPCATEVREYSLLANL